ncbi:MAG TPA: ABC transporter substrate-binding protein [Chloroflexota bacterium]|nr:ABC transporter substrate-binding protein [Chloroflexota bacterium]
MIPVWSEWRRSLPLAPALLGLALAVACAPPASPASAPTGEQAAGAAGPAAAPAPAPVSLRLHLPSRSTSYLPWYLAIERGYFQEQNLDVEILQAPGATGVKALVAGEMQFSGAASSAVPAIAQGTPLKVIYVQSAKANYWFTTRPEINTLQDLKGKRVVVPNLSQADTYSRLLVTAMERAGMDPANDVTLIGAGSAGGGGSDILVGALVAGVADGMVGNVLQRLTAENQGFHTIYSFGEESPDLQGGILTSEDMLEKRPDVLRRFLVAAVKGTRVMEQDPDTSVDVLLKYVEMDRGDAAKGLSYVRPLMAKDGLITPAEQEAGLATMKESIPDADSLTVAQVFDLAPLQDAIRTVDASGWKAK